MHCIIMIIIINHSLTLSHSQASVERGLSVNSEAVIPNLKNEMLVILRTVYDAVKSLDGDLSSFTITKELLASCKSVTFINLEGA